MEARDVTVRELIAALLDEPMDNLIVVRDEYGREIRRVTIATKERDSLGALFG